MSTPTAYASPTFRFGKKSDVCPPSFEICTPPSLPRMMRFGFEGSNHIVRKSPNDRRKNPVGQTVRSSHVFPPSSLTVMLSLLTMIRLSFDGSTRIWLNAYGDFPPATFVSLVRRQLVPPSSVRYTWLPMIPRPAGGGF